MLPSSESNSSQSSFDSPVSQHPLHQHAWFPAIPRHRELPKYPRYYSTPLKDDAPDSTPLQMYGLESREPSIAEKPRRFQRFSRALGDIREDFTLQIDSQNNADRPKSGPGRRQSTFMLDAPGLPLDSSGPGSSSSSASPSSSGRNSPMLSGSEPPSQSRPLSTIFSPESWAPPVRRLSRRLSMLNFSQRKHRYRSGLPSSISQPNLIGSSTDI